MKSFLENNYARAKRDCVPRGDRKDLKKLFPIKKGSIRKYGDVTVVNNRAIFIHTPYIPPCVFKDHHSIPNYWFYNLKDFDLLSPAEVRVEFMRRAARRRK